MKAKAALAIVIAAILLLLPAALNLALRTLPRPSPQLEVRVPYPELTIEVNGRPVYAGPDPPTSNFINYLTLTFGKQPVSVVDTSGTSRQITSTSLVGGDANSYRDYYFTDRDSAYLRTDWTQPPLWIWTYYGGKAYNGYIRLVMDSLYIALGNGTQAFSRDVYKLAREVARYGVGVSYGYNSTNVWLDVVSSFTMGRDLSVTEVGLIMKLRNPYCISGVGVNLDSMATYDVLLLYTVLPSPVRLKQGDTVTIRYRFYLRPFTVQGLKWLKLWLPSSVDYNYPITETVNATDATTTLKYHPLLFLANQYVQVVYNYRSVTAIFSQFSDPSKRLYLAYGTGSQPWSPLDRNVYSYAGRVPVSAIVASGNAVQLVFYINNPSSTPLNIKELALQVNVTDVNGVWRLVTLARWTVDYTVQPNSGVNLVVRIATP